MKEICVSEVRIKKVNKKILAVADVVINDGLIIHGIKLLQNYKGIYYIVFPDFFNKKKNKYSQYAHPLNQEVRDIITNAILNEYEKEK